MLPSDLLINRVRGESLEPRRLVLNRGNRAIATDLITIFQRHVGKTLGELDTQLRELEGEETDFKIKRGLAHLLKAEAFSQFEQVSPLEPQELRQRLFALATQTVPIPQNANRTLATLSDRLSTELEREVPATEILQGLYADLKENRILTRFDAPEPDALLHRYNLSQVQGIFYKATHIRINAHRNDPGEYKLLFRYLKLFGLMTYIEGDADHGFTLTIDGPASLFSSSTRYGTDIAKLIPALLHVTKWSLEAALQWRDSYSRTPKSCRFTLDSACDLVSHYPPGKPYDSQVEAAFADRWNRLKTDWALEREVDLLPIPGSVMIPDFRLVHPDGRSVLLEIVGYWRPDYLRKKFSQVRQAENTNLVLAVSERLNLEKAGVRLQDVPVPIVWFKGKLDPQAVLGVLETFE
ncbi:DUF790 family protein [Vacuolonema iberomarrocanum]|uniref:DUF790 family protein n=1 Tax=Vacuolonema iberomarrocanum TaxID=3454632 RepID=UPI001A0939EB|nr:DUF790 family protein [filamentous cyanobacterium LEGE 07170]